MRSTHTSAALLLIVATFVSTFADAAAAAANSTSNEVVVQRELAYGSDKRQTIDVYAPANAERAPVIFMVHGGGWRYGDKTNARVVENKIARWVARGFIFVSVNYRMLPELDGLQQRDDITAALAFAQQHAANWGGDAAQFILMGHSAGAHLVALINANPTIALNAGAQPWLGTVALDSGALDVPAIMQRRHLPLYDAAFGNDQQRWQLASPRHQLIRGTPPLLAVCSTQRRDNPCQQAQVFMQDSAALDDRVVVLPQNLSHSQVNETLGLPGAYTDAVETFIASLNPAFIGLLRQ